MADETESRIYRSKRMASPEPGETKVYYPKRYYGERDGNAPASTPGRTTAEPSISAEEIRANSTLVAGAPGTPSGTTASGGAATTPTSAR